MKDNEKIISIKWKFAAILMTVLFLLHSVFSILIYTGTSENFTRHRQDLRDNHINIAKALVDESFLVLEQISEAMVQLQNLSYISTNTAESGLSTFLDDNWLQWQMSWGLENLVLFNYQAEQIKFLGDVMPLNRNRILDVIQTEMPSTEIICTDLCFLNVIIPVLTKEGQTGALSVTRSLVDIIIDYWTATRIDLGILNAEEGENSKDLKHIRLSAMSNAMRNKFIFEHLLINYKFTDLLEKSHIIRIKEQIYEVVVFPIRKEGGHRPPFFLLIDNITNSQKHLDNELNNLLLYGGLSLLVSLGVVLLMLHFSLGRISRLSTSLPLLARQQYNQFRKQLRPGGRFLIGHDEVDQLTLTAMTLTDQLELLEREVQTNTRLLTEKSKELVTERDFINQLVETAPIILITQDASGSILSINQTGAAEFEMQQEKIIRSKFDNFLPTSETTHLTKLKRLREEKHHGLFQFDGTLITSSGNSRYISWIHSVMHSELSDQEIIILTIGVDVSERKLAEEQTRWMATHDQLTGLSNRRYFQEEFNHLLSVSERYEQKMALLYLDLDQFKIINDTSGHQAGDNLLQMVAAVLQETVRGSDVLSRIGGDEFTLLISQVKQGGIESVAKKINNSLNQIDFHFAGKKYPVSCSIGISLYPEHGTTMQELLSNADLAMYQAKEAGRGQFHVFNPDQAYQKRLTKRRYWKELIEKAISEERFILYYQPIKDLSNDVISHYECLIRMQMDGGAILMPGDFIGMAEELGLIGKIDRIVIKLAIQQHLKFQQQNQDINLSVNLSGFSFNDLSIFDDVSTLFEKPGVDPGKIIFEITETSAVSNFSAAQSLIKMIKSLGCCLALDDFGVGFSSFYYLKHLPVEYIKIDGSFVQQIEKNYEDRIFVKAISEVSHALGKKTVAEFVENPEILNIIRDLGVDYVQGFHVGKPILFE